tara:strand:- start:680 stop:1531 length:852 start_codon:yes stop_codon:yes gene_type:complete
MSDIIKINSLSGGKTSAYIAANYPSDRNIFSLVRTTDENCLFPDKKIRQYVEDKIQKPFIGTLEMNDIIYTMIDLEQFIGSEIDWVSGEPFDEIIKRKSGKIYLPNKVQRICTIEMKVNPIANWCYENLSLPVEMRIGFRANETRRANNMIDRMENGVENFKFKVGEKNGRNKWKSLPYRIANFPLIQDGIFKDTIEEFWKDKPVRFAYMNNCVGCFHRNELLLKHMSDKSPQKFEWFAKQERENENGTWRTGITYDKIKDYKKQLDLFDKDFNDCDSGYCGL